MKKLNDEIIDLLEPSKIKSDVLMSEGIVLDLEEVLDGLSLRLR